MPDSNTNDFIQKLTEIVETNLSDEKFGVSQLADEIGMSRSNLLRKVQKQTNLSVSLFIRQIRLNKAYEFIKTTDMSVSEISYQVGFNSPSYFIKCFREHYGYSPGETNKETTKNLSNKNRLLAWTISVFFLLIFLVVIILIFNPFKKEITKVEKSIAVLPFKNDSSDSTNVYIVNGLMESILNNLQKIEDLRVISRTSVEKYRNSNKSIPEIASELNVNYFVEGSGQKIGNQIKLSVQLIDGNLDKHLWSEQYNKELADIFSIQNEVATHIANKVEAIITPEEAERINTIPTKNLEAHKNLLKALELLRIGNRESLEKAVPLLRKAIQLDPEYARANANLAISFFYLDILKSDKVYPDSIAYYADQALLYDPQLAQSHLAKAFAYMNAGRYSKAVPYLEKAYECNPNSPFVVQTLADFYTTYMPNTKKYLEYALKGIQINVIGKDSAATSYIYLHLSNAFIQTGFIEEAEKYINLSLQYYPDNLYSKYLKVYIMYAINNDIDEMTNGLLAAHKQDTSRIDIIQEIGKTYYSQSDFDNAYKYYKLLLDTKQKLKLSIYVYENSHIAYVYKQKGFLQEADSLMQAYMNFATTDISIYKDLHLASYYAYYDNFDKAIHHLKSFTKQREYHYWVLLFMRNDPIYSKLKNIDEFDEIIETIEKNYWEEHKKMKTMLKSKGLI